MKKKYVISLTIIAVIIAGVLVGPNVIPKPSFCTFTRSEIGALLKDDFGTFEFRCLPSSKFGVGTIYEDLGKTGGCRMATRMATTSWLLATRDSWFSPDITEELRKTYLEEIIKTANLGTVNISTVLSSGGSLAGDFGRFLQLSRVSADLENLQGVEIKISAQNLIWRQINWLSFLEISGSEQFNHSLTKEIENSKIVVAAQDVAFQDLEIEVSLDRSLNPEVSAEMFEESGDIADDTNLDWHVKARQESKSHLRVTYASKDPVIIAVLYKKPRLTRGIGDVNSRISQWSTVTLDDTRLIEQGETQ